MDASAITKISKFLSKTLRHAPGRIGLTLDANGWADVDEMIACAGRKGMSLSEAVIHEVVTNNDKKRFTLSDDGRRIRANQGHSIEVDLELQPTEPPERLFHGTVAAALDAMREQGLLPMQRQQVHLSFDEATAKKVGARRGKPILLTVRSGDMARAGHRFYVSANGVWLTDAVPADFIEFPLAD